MAIIDPTPAASAASALHVPHVFTIVGSDNGGDAGIQADLRILIVPGCCGIPAVTAIAAQNTLGVAAVESLTSDVVAAQIGAVAGDVGMDAARTDMLDTPRVVEAVLSALNCHPIVNFIVNSIMVSTGGAQLSSDATTQAVAKWLFPRALFAAPNLPEASALLGRQVCMVDDMLPAAYDLLALGPHVVLLKGGHLAGASTTGEDSVLQDVLVAVDNAERIYAHTYIDVPHAHGAGCVLSAAIATHPARGDALRVAIETSLDYLLRAIGAGRHLAPGRGADPLNHGFASRSLIAPRSFEVDADGD